MASRILTPQQPEHMLISQAVMGILDNFKVDCRQNAGDVARILRSGKAVIGSAVVQMPPKVIGAEPEEVEFTFELKMGTVATKPEAADPPPGKLADDLKHGRLPTSFHKTYDQYLEEVKPFRPVPKEVWERQKADLKAIRDRIDGKIVPLDQLTDEQAKAIQDGKVPIEVTRGATYHPAAIGVHRKSVEPKADVEKKYGLPSGSLTEGTYEQYLEEVVPFPPISRDAWERAQQDFEAAEVKADLDAGLDKPQHL